MKKLVLAFIALIMTGTAILIGAPAAHAVYPDCWQYWCNWVVNSGFEDPSSSPWVKSPNAAIASDSICGYPTKVVKLKRVTGQQREWIYQRMYVQNSGLGRSQLDFKLDLRDDQNSPWDELRITVKNLDTNETEIFLIRGSAYDTNCPNPALVIDLTNDYRNHNVELKFETSPLQFGTFVIDDVRFWTH